MAEGECPVLHKTEEPKEVDIYRDTPVRLLGLLTLFFTVFCLHLYLYLSAVCLL